MKELNFQAQRNIIIKMYICSTFQDFSVILYKDLACTNQPYRCYRGDQ